MTLLSLAVLTATVFFVILPAIFSLHSLFEYRKIRHTVVLSSKKEILSVNSKTGEFYRFFGQFDGFKDNDEIWVRSDDLLVKIRLRHGKVLSLPEKVEKAQRGFWGERIPGSLRILKWSKMGTLASGTKLFLFGKVRREGSVFLFDAGEKNSLIVMYEGDEEQIDRELVVQTKNRYTYFQSPSLSVLGVGSLLSCLISVFEYQLSGFSFQFFLFLLTAAFPVFFFIPPGCFLLLLSYNLKYKVFLLRHDYYFHYFSQQAEKPDTQRYWRRLWRFEIAAIAAAVADVVVNYILYLSVIYFWVL